MYLARVYVTLKTGVNDPQGKTVQGGLKSLGYPSVQGVRVGKYIELRVDEKNRAKAERQVREMCQKLLANPVIEEFRFDLEAAPSPKATTKKAPAKKPARKK